jgi:hypothetical protein
VLIFGEGRGSTALLGISPLLGLKLLFLCHNALSSMAAQWLHDMVRARLTSSKKEVGSVMEM